MLYVINLKLKTVADVDRFVFARKKRHLEICRIHIILLLLCAFILSHQNFKLYKCHNNPMHPSGFRCLEMETITPPLGDGWRYQNP